MKRKLTYYICFLIILALISIITRAQSNLRDFYFEYQKPDSLYPFVNEYLQDSIGIVTKKYYLFEKLDKNKIRITEYNHSFEKFLVTIDSVTPNEIYRLKHTYISDFITEINYNPPSLILSFSDSISKFESQGYSNIVTDSLQYQIFFISTDSIDTVMTKEINNMRVKTLIMKGDVLRTYDYEEHDENYFDYVETETWYSEGIGMSKIVYSMLLDNTKIEEKYIRTISTEQFYLLMDKK